MKNNLSRKVAADIFHAVLTAIDPYGLIKGRIGEIRSIYREGNYGKLYLVSFGKAAYAMTKAVSDFADDILTKGIMITKYGHVQEGGISGKIEVYEAAHPVPDLQGVLATERVIGLLEKADSADTRRLFDIRRRLCPARCSAQGYFLGRKAGDNAVAP